MIGAEFLPLYLQLLLHLLFLAGCRLLCGLAENRRCQALFDCMAEAVKMHGSSNGTGFLNC